VNAFWFRRDLRLQDNHGLFEALKAGRPVLPVFIFDSEILSRLSSKKDARVEFILNQIEYLNKELGSTQIHVEYGEPVQVWDQLIKKFKIQNIFCNHDYEPQAIKRDQNVAKLAQGRDVGFYSFKDQVVFEKDEICKDDGKPYTVFTAYSKKWKARLKPDDLREFPSEKQLKNFIQNHKSNITLDELGFQPTEQKFPARVISKVILKKYKAERDFPNKSSTTHLGLHLRFGTISARKAVKIAKQFSETWLNELIWREFFQMILFHFPHTVNKSFKEKYDKIKWRDNKADFKAWCDGQTGYPIVDAGMRELNETGYMHNRVRMITASFLVKHLLIDWRLGERYFAEKLQDYDLAANIGNWQWVAGSGCDAAPYFRVFNPEIQTKKFDPDFMYIKKWVPEFGSNSYPEPIVDHKVARIRTLKAYNAALKGT